DLHLDLHLALRGRAVAAGGDARLHRGDAVRDHRAVEALGQVALRGRAATTTAGRLGRALAVLRAARALVVVEHARHLVAAARVRLGLRLRLGLGRGLRRRGLRRRRRLAVGGPRGGALGLLLLRLLLLGLGRLLRLRGGRRRGGRRRLGGSLGGLVRAGLGGLVVAVLLRVAGLVGRRARRHLRRLV